MSTRIVSSLLFAAAIVAGMSAGLSHAAPNSPPHRLAPYLVRDLNTNPIGSDPSGFVALGDRVLFEASDSRGYENLWVTDGTTAGTHTLSLGRGGGDLLQMVRAGGEVYFGGAGSLPFQVLWETNGTQAGTQIVDTPMPSGWSVLGESLTAAGSELYFLASNQHVFRLYRTDGTTSGTHFIHTIAIGPGSGYHFNEPWLAAAGNMVYFDAYQPATGKELWETDGTAAGTRLVKDINPGKTGSNVDPLKAMGNLLYISANDGAHGTELWKTDGTTAGTVMVKDIAPEVAGHNIGSEPTEMTIAGNEAFFLACSRSASNPHCGRGGGSPNEIWKTDGTAAGTGEVKQVSVSEGLTFIGDDQSGKPALLFIGWDGANGYKLWRTDGTTAGTQPLGVSTGGVSYLTPAVVGAHPLVFFVGGDKGTQSQIWETDGTAAGTKLIANDSPAFLVPVTLQGKPGVIFSGYDSSHGTQPWFSDGTAAGTRLIDALDRGDQGSNIAGLTAVGSKAFLTTVEIDDCPAGRIGSPPCPRSAQVYVSNGTEAGTSLLHSFWWAWDIAPIGSNAVFLTEDPTRGLQLEASNGTSSGTHEVAKLDAFENNFSADLYGDGAKAFITVDGKALWVSNGTAAGTRKIPSIPNLAPGWSPAAVSHGYLYFAAGGAKRYALWRSDGTARGTKRIWSGSKSPTAITRSPWGVVFETRTSKSQTWNLWSSDSANGKTQLLKSVWYRWDQYASFASDGSRLFFNADDPKLGAQLWSTKGTAATTKLVSNIAPGRSRSSIENLTPFGGKVFFEGDDDVHGHELWSSDGTAKSTSMVRDIWPGVTGSTPDELTPFDGRLYFAANHLGDGIELWSTNGTRAGTAMVADIYPGPISSYPYDLTVVNGMLFFEATDPLHGSELWALR